MLKAPAYINASGVIGAAPTYEWTPHKGTELIEKTPKNISDAVMQMSLRANFTLAIGVAEWIMWRLDSAAVYPQLALYINALWARTIDKSYLKVNSLDTPKDASDPKTGPLIEMEDALYTAFRKSTQNHPERGMAVAGLVSLVRYTLPTTEGFDNWLRRTLARFIEHFRLDPETRAGCLVPRAFLDPDVEITPDVIPALLDEQLSQIQWEGNPFLATPDQMRAAGFTGTPYRCLQ